MNQPLRIATRHSPLAMWQAHHVAKLLASHGVSTSIVPLVSEGDVDMSPIDGTRQVGLFTKRIQRALLEDEADVAVHSLKDLPTQPIAELRLAAVPKRETVRDCLIFREGLQKAGGSPIDRLPMHAKVGTGSCRRAAQLWSTRPDLKIESLRGNVQTRLSKMDEQSFDAIFLAEAGLLRLQMKEIEYCPLSCEEMLPAPGQGALGIEVRDRDKLAIQAVEKLEDPNARLAVTAERHLLASLHGGCLAPIAAYAIVESGTLRMDSVVLSQNGSDRIDLSDEVELMEHQSHDAHESNLQSAIEMATRMSEAMIAKGAIELMGRS